MPTARLSSSPARCADPPVPDLAGGWHVLLHDNLWGTNFPMWNEGAASFRFVLSRTPTPA